jgi:hypothetical protein
MPSWFNQLMACKVLNIPQSVDYVQHDICIINRPMSQTFRELQVFNILLQMYWAQWSLMLLTFYEAARLLS